ncbi:RagB/SusD family nutrient uptake outer membrane protein [Pedobacter sp. WC2501]|uniref:RagB/SusD family nutrient uptake outer membrane protein n=1 Tax=Pedobacter sp. WC2501 TaxID=3461400 RepID=UPI004045EDFF
MKKIILYTATILMLPIISCQKTFLSPEAVSTITSQTFYKTPGDIANAVTACYQPLQLNTMYGDYIQIMTELRSDNVEDQNPGGDAGREFNVDRFLAGSDNSIFSSTYFAHYNAISRCNQVLSHLDVVTDVALKSQYEGEARFLRALYYFNLVRFWGGVPLVLQPISTQDALTVGRSAPADVYAAIEYDLNKASTLLPKTYSASNLGRASAGAALGMLGKVYLTEQKYSEAVSTLKQLMPVGTNPYKYALLPNIADVFSTSNKLNAEVLFAVHYDKTLINEGHAFGTYTISPVIDPNLLNAYQATDTRRALLNVTKVDATVRAINKYYDTYDATTKLVGADYIILRYSDVLLMYAEALNEISYSNSATSDNFVYLNLVRNRAKALPFTPALLPNQASFRTYVLQERRLELPFEWSRWFDLVRTNTAIHAFQSTALTKQVIQPYQLLYPLPFQQVTVIHDPSIFPQNPGY